MEQTLLSIEHLKKSYDDNLILDDINLEVHQGEVIVLVGPSGCGKSTMLRCINALEPIQGGEIKLNGEKIDPKNKNIAELRQKIGMVFQSYELFPHLTVLDNILLAPMKVQKRKKEEAEKERQAIEGENKAKEQYRQSLDTEIADKVRQLKDGRKAKMDSILDSVSSLVGVGKSAAVEKENAKLKAENERIRKAFPDAVKNKVAELTQALVAEKQKAETERDRALVQSRSLGVERDKVVKQLQEQQANEQQHIRQAVSQATAEKDKTIRLLQSALKASRHILNVLADILYKANELFKRAIDAIIHFGTEQHKAFFAPSEAGDIKSVLQEYGETTEQQNAVGAWLCDYAESRQPFDEIKHRHTLKEVGDVAEGKYDWKIERGRGGVTL